MELYNTGLKLINQIVNTFSHKYRIIDKTELKSHLTEKLVLIMNKFDASREIPFKYFAIPSLKGYAWNYIRDHGRTVKVPRKYSELYMKFNSLNRKYDYKLTVPMAAELMEIDEELLRTALEASNLKFSEITSFNSTLICDKSLDLATAYVRNIPEYIYSILEEIFIDEKVEEKVFLKYGLSPHQGRRLIKPYLENIFKLRD